MAVETGELKIEVESPSAWGRELTITVPAAQLDRERHAAVSRLAKKIRIPGFRKGKVPADVIRRRFGQALEQEMLERVIGDAYREALRRENLQPISQANVDRVDYKQGEDLTFHVAIEVRPEIEMARIGGFRLKRTVPPVEESQVEAVLERLRDQQAVWEPVESGTLVNGDMVHVEITPLADSEQGKPRAYRLVLGEGQAVPAIEDAIRALEAGQESDFTVELPEQADDPASPTKPHDLHLRVIEARRPIRPPLDDEFAKSVGEFESLADLREKITADLAREAERQADENVRRALLQEIIAANPIDVPSSMIDQYVSQLVPQREGEDPNAVNQVRDAARPAAADAIRRMLVIEKIAETEALHATDAEVDARLEELASRTDRSAAELRARLAKSGRLEEMRHEITEEKVFQYLMTLSTIE